MAVAEAFLRRVVPFNSLDSFREVARYTVWHVALVALPRWTSDVRVKRVFIPRTFLLCGGEGGAEGMDLLYADAIGVDDSTVAAAVRWTREAFLATSVENRPSKVNVSVEYFDETLTAALRFDDAERDAEIFCECLRQDATFRAELRRVPAPPDTGEMVEWCVRHRRMHPCCTLPPSLGGEGVDDVIRAAAECWPLAKGTLRGGEDAVVDAPAVVCAVTLRTAAPWSFAVVVQRPVHSPPPTAEGVVAGPMRPRPIGAELHLHTDMGDAWHIFRRLHAPMCAESYPELLSDDGEMFVQLGPVEGVAMADIRRAALAQENQHATFEWSRSSLVVPRITLNTQGKRERASPVDPSEVSVVSVSPSHDDLVCAARALREFVGRVEVVSDLVYTLKSDPADDWEHLAPIAACAWCERRRRSLKKCGRCRVVAYCNADHQLRDWKSSHRSECKMYELSASEAAAFEGSTISNVHLSNVRTILQCLERCAIERKGGEERSSAVVLHVVQGGDAEEFADALAVALDGNGAPLRFVFWDDAIPPSRRHNVIRIDGRGVTEQPTTGVLGDEWHVEGHARNDPAPWALISLRSGKYAATHSDVTSPRMVVSLGGASMQGMSFFSVAAQQFVDHWMGKVPIVVTDPHRVAQGRTKTAFHERCRLTGPSLAFRFEEVVNVENCVRTPVVWQGIPTFVNGYVSMWLPTSINPPTE